MATSVITFSDASVKGWNNVTLVDLTGLPTIPANTMLEDIVISCNVKRDGGVTARDAVVRFIAGGSTIHEISNMGRETRSFNFSLRHVVVNNGGTLSYSNGSNVLKIQVYHRNNWLTGQATWTASNISITATYYMLTYTILTTISPSGSGMVTGGGNYEVGSTATLKAIPATGYKFARWNDGVEDNPRNVVLTAPDSVTYTAYFEKLPPEFTAASLTYLNKQISTSNKVPCGEGYIISVGVT